MRGRIFLIIGIFVLVTPQNTLGGPGFRSSIRDLLGPQTPNNYGVYTIERVVENHTAHLSIGRRVRYIGVGNYGLSSMNPNEAQNAYHFHKWLAFSNLARLEFDTGRQDDRGDLKAYVFIRPWPNADNELFLNAELIRQGHARFVPDEENTRYDQLFRSLEEEAILARRGIWKVPVVAREEHTDGGDSLIWRETLNEK